MDVQPPEADRPAAMAQPVWQLCSRLANERAEAAVHAVLTAVGRHRRPVHSLLPVALKMTAKATTTVTANYGRSRPHLPNQKIRWRRSSGGFAGLSASYRQVK